MKDNKPIITSALENESRRKAVKTIVGGVTTLAAYNLLPAKWGTPIIEQVFLPAHAATSGASLQPQTKHYTGSITLLVSNGDRTGRETCVSITGDNAVFYYTNGTSTSSGTGTVSGGVSFAAGDWVYQVAFSNLNQNTVTIDMDGTFGSSGILTSTGSTDLNSTTTPCS